jgi:hypothetical protein
LAWGDQFLIDCSDEIGYFNDPDEGNAFRNGTRVVRNIDVTQQWGEKKPSTLF